MKTFLEQLSAILQEAFNEAGYPEVTGKVTVSNRPDLCEYQCNGAMAGAKIYHKAPMVLASAVEEKLSGHPAFAEVKAVAPGFLNLTVSPAFIKDYLTQMEGEEKYGAAVEKEPKTIIIDYGGPNVAKPLHVGHLRSAVIGESVKRILRFFGNKVIGDVHLGDWGLQMGLIIAELSERKPELCYFDETYTGPYPEEAPFTISELEEIYPTASKKSKVDETASVEAQEASKAFAKKAHDATQALQEKRPGYVALWEHILAVSVADLKKNYEKLSVSFDLWKKESDAQPYIPDMIKKMQEMGLARESEGALVCDVAEPTDTKEIPPCILKKSDGASLYTTTDLATLVEREKLFSPDEVLYVVDKRQEMHFTQVFRTARKAKIVRPETKLTFLGFGTMNGSDGKPFKTRSGGTMRLENLIGETTEQVLAKMTGDHALPEGQQEKTAAMIAVAALKYGDLSNQAAKDYVFDPERFTSFDGNTGPYILYVTVRILSILEKAKANGILPGDSLPLPEDPSIKKLCLTLAALPETLNAAYGDYAPHRICGYLFELSDAFNQFYKNVSIMGEPDPERQKALLALALLVRKVLLCGIDLLGFEAPEKM